MSLSLMIPVLLVVVAALSWKVFPQRIADDVAEWALTQQQGRRQIFLYRVWSVALAGVGVALAISTLSGN